MLLMPASVITIDHPGYTAIQRFVRMKQKGCCNLCRNAIAKEEPIVKKGKQYGRYYHLSCAQKVNII